MANRTDAAQSHDAALRIKIGMPQMAARGLSENWLFKFCGDAHWNAITDLYGVESNELVTEQGERIYASFVAIRSRYTIPLGNVRENDVIEFSLTLDQFGSGIMRSRQEGVIDGRSTISTEMISKFVMRAREGQNELLRASVRPRPGSTSAPEMSEPPALMRNWQDVRERKFHFDPNKRSIRYVPNPYVDYNGAGLLYFASYSAIADHCERLFVKELVKGDWALTASTIERDVFYFGNLDLGREIEGIVHSTDFETDTARSHTTLIEAGTERRLSEVYTIKARHQID